MITLSSLRRSVAKTFLSSVQNRLSRLYLFFGQINEPIDSPPENDGIDYINYNRNNIFAIKEVLPSDISFVVKRIDYEPGVEYLPYNSKDGSGDYVLNTTNFSAYVCVKSGIGPSVEMPAHLTTAPLELSDGYIWRYVYTIPLYLRDKFLTPQWMPVSNSLTESFFSDGGIDSVSILDAGEGYEAESTSIVISGANGTGANAILSPVVQDGKIISVIVHESGYGYKSPIISVISPVATRPAVIYTNLTKLDIRSAQSLIQTLAVPGTLESIDIIDGGSGYTETATLTLEGDGSGAAITFVRNDTSGEITSVNLISRGEGYTWAKISITDDILVGGSGAEFHVNVSRVGGFGKDAIADLNATDLMVYQNFSREMLDGIPIENKIYKFGLIDSPKTVTGGLYPKDFVTVGNFVTAIPTNQISNYTIGTLVYNEFPTTANTKSFIVEEQIVGVTTSGIRLRALEDGKIITDRRYYKDGTTSFIASAANYNLSVDRQMVSACYALKSTGIDTSVFTPGKILTKDSKKFVVVASTQTTILVSSLEGAILNTSDTLTDGTVSITPDEIVPPLLDKKSGSILVIETPAKPITYGPQQTVSFRTVIKF